MSRSADHPLANAFRRTVLENVSDAPEYCGVLLSAGVDSQAVLQALLRLGRKPWVISFRMPDREPRDWLVARDTASRLGLGFEDVRLDPSKVSLEAYVRWAVDRGLRSKAGIECFWPRRAALDAAVMLGLDGVLTGDGGDGYFGLSKKAMMHVRPGGAPAMDEFRRWYFGRSDWSQTCSIREYAREIAIEVAFPLHDERLLKACEGYDWERLNRPMQKQPIRDAFPEVADLPLHANLQLHDSGISEAFEVLTPPGRRSPVAFYNQVAREADARQESLFE